MKRVMHVVAVAGLAGLVTGMALAAYAVATGAVP